MKPFPFPQWENGQEVKLKASLNICNSSFLFCIPFLLSSIFSYFLMPCEEFCTGQPMLCPSFTGILYLLHIYISYIGAVAWLFIIKGFSFPSPMASRSLQQLLFTTAQFLVIRDKHRKQSNTGRALCNSHLSFSFSSSFISFYFFCPFISFMHRWGKCKII